MGIVETALRKIAVDQRWRAQAISTVAARYKADERFPLDEAVQYITAAVAAAEQAENMASVLAKDPTQ